MYSAVPLTRLLDAGPAADERRLAAAASIRSPNRGDILLQAGDGRENRPRPCASTGNITGCGKGTELPPVLAGDVVGILFGTRASGAAALSEVPGGNRSHEQGLRPRVTTGFPVCSASRAESIMAYGSCAEAL